MENITYTYRGQKPKFFFQNQKLFFLDSFAFFLFFVFITIVNWKESVSRTSIVCDNSNTECKACIGNSIKKKITIKKKEQICIDCILQCIYKHKNVITDTKKNHKLWTVWFVLCIIFIEKKTFFGLLKNQIKPKTIQNFFCSPEVIR